jgi:hypothetical protein
MPCVDIEYALEEKFVTALQGVFAFDDKFIYNEDDIQTKIIITPDYPEDNTPIKVPHLIVTGISYEFNLDTSMFRNFAGNVFGDNGIQTGNKYANIIPYSVTLICLAQLFESKDLANKVINYISFEASEAFDYVGLNITRTIKGQSSPQTQFPEKIFQTPVTVTGNLHWTGTKTVDMLNISNVLQKIKSNIENYIQAK